MLPFRYLKGRVMQPVRNPLMRVTAFVLLLTQLSACSKWQNQPLTPSRELPSGSRVTMVNGARYRVSDAAVVGDSLISWAGPDANRSRTAVPVGEIVKIESSQFDPVRTVLLSLGVIFSVGALLAQAAKNISFSPGRL